LFEGIDETIPLVETHRGGVMDHRSI
jgi:hypothetical protein